MPKITICTISNCGKPIGAGSARGWCSAHYNRWQNHGDPLGGGTPLGDPLKFIQETVLPYSGDDCIIWPYARDRSGRAKVSVGGRTETASRYVCSLINGHQPTPQHQAAHECGKGHTGCLTPRHLTWKTPAENAADKNRHGTMLFGERIGSSKLSNAQVIEIRALQGIISNRKIAAQFNVCHSTIDDIFNGERRRRG